MSGDSGRIQSVEQSETPIAVWYISFTFLGPPGEMTTPETYELA